MLLTREQRRKLVELLRRTPPASSLDRRTALLGDAGSLALNRDSGNDKIDFELIVQQLERLGANDALAGLIENAAGYVRGTDVARELDALLHVVKSSAVPAMTTGSPRPPASSGTPAPGLELRRMADIGVDNLGGEHGRGAPISRSHAEPVEDALLHASASLEVVQQWFVNRGTQNVRIRGSFPRLRLFRADAQGHVDTVWVEVLAFPPGNAPVERALMSALPRAIDFVETVADFGGFVFVAVVQSRQYAMRLRPVIDRVARRSFCSCRFVVGHQERTVFVADYFDDEETTLF